MHVAKADDYFLPKKQKVVLERSYSFEVDLRNQSGSKAIAQIESELKAKQQIGYWLANLDTSFIQDSILCLEVYVGQRYEIQFVTTDNDTQKIKDYRAVLKARNELLKELNNNGYPYAEVLVESNLDAIESNQSSIVTTELKIDRGPLITLDTFLLVDSTKIKPRFIGAYLGLKQGDIYRQDLYDDLQLNINQLSFAQQSKPPEVYIFADKAVARLFVEDQKAGNVNILVGFANAEEGNTGLQLTGKFFLNLVSPFGTGKEILLDWERLPQQSQRLRAGFKAPFIAGSPFGADVGFRFYLQDSTFNNISGNVAALYNINGASAFSVQYSVERSNVLNVDTAQVIQNRQLPNVLDYNKTIYGVGYEYAKLDYRPNPLKGITIDVSANLGQRNIRRNNLIANLKDNEGESLNQLYDEIDLNTIQFQFELDLYKFWKNSNRLTTLTAFRGAWIQGSGLLENEKYQIGGNQILRGFNERSIFTSYYGILTLEERFLINKRSYIYLFTDIGYTEHPTLQQADWPFGFGGGLSFGTKIGNLTLTYALGRQAGNPILLRDGKVHIGYINYF